MIVVTFGLELFKRRINEGFYFIQEYSVKGIAKKDVVKVFDMTSETVITVSAFRKKVVEKRAVIEEIRAEIFINSENAVAMRNIDEFKIATVRAGIIEPPKDEYHDLT